MFQLCIAIHGHRTFLSSLPSYTTYLESFLSLLSSSSHRQHYKNYLPIILFCPVRTSPNRVVPFPSVLNGYKENVSRPNSAIILYYSWPSTATTTWPKPMRSWTRRRRPRSVSTSRCRSRSSWRNTILWTGKALWLLLDLPGMLHARLVLCRRLRLGSLYSGSYLDRFCQNRP